MAMTLEEMWELALERLSESAEHEEQWDLLFRTPGSKEIIYIPHDSVRDWDFEPEEWGWYGIGESRQAAILSGERPTEEEIKAWKLARASEAIARIASECCHAFIVPVCDRMVVQGYAVFDGGMMDGDPDSEPSLLDVFLKEDAAIVAIQNLGIVE